MPIRLYHLVDTSPITVSESTNMALIAEIFRKLGCRQVFATFLGGEFFHFCFRSETCFTTLCDKVLKRGDLVGILTKKDLLHYIGDKRERNESHHLHCLNFFY